MIDQGPLLTAARQAVIDILLNKAPNRDDNLKLVTTLIETLGQIKWRRSLGKNNQPRVIEFISNQISTEDENRLEWISPILIRFKILLSLASGDATEDIFNLTQSINSTCIFEQMDDLKVELSYTEDEGPKYSSLNVSTEEMSEVLRSNDLMLFCVALYHSDIRSYLN